MQMRNSHIGALDLHYQGIGGSRTIFHDDDSMLPHSKNEMLRALRNHDSLVRRRKDGAQPGAADLDRWVKSNALELFGATMNEHDTCPLVIKRAEEKSQRGMLSSHPQQV